jgi:4-amino-4-deoxy-L-arabinose transferase-like glycosyltransferase
METSKINPSNLPEQSKSKNETDQNGMEHSREMLYLAGAVLSALVVRLAIVARVYPLFLSPDQDYWKFGYEMGHVAYAVVTGHGYANPYWGPIGLTVKVPPVYVYFMAAVFKIFGIYTKSAALCILSIGSLFSALTCIPIYFIGKQLVGVRAARWASWLWVPFPPALYFSADRMWYFSLATLLVCLMLLFAFRLGSTTSLWEWTGFGALAGFAALTNPVTLTIFPFLAGWACYRLQKNEKQWGIQAGACVLVFCAALAPWLIRNYEVFHRPVFIRDDFWLEFYVGNVGNWPYRWNGSIHPSMNSSELREYIDLGELNYMAHKKAQAIAYVEAHPGLFITRSIRRFIYVWTGFWSIHGEYTSALLGLTINFCYLAFSFLAFTGLWKAYRLHPDKAILVAIIFFVFPGVYYITHIEMGYRHPLDPILTLLAVYALVPVPETEHARVPSKSSLAIQGMEVEGAPWAPKPNL